jgi:acetolactate synthase-1/2/3 large subunit
VTGHRRAPLFDPLHPNYAGELGPQANPELVARMKACDLVIVAGARLDEITAQGPALFDRAWLVQAYPDAEEIGRYRPGLAIHASPLRFAQALDNLNPMRWPRWTAATKAAHEEYLAWSTPCPGKSEPGKADPGAILAWLRENLPADAILCDGARDYAGWFHRFYRFRRPAPGVPVGAEMGCGIPAAVAMQRLYPARRVVALHGESDFMAGSAEFATAIQYRLPLIVLVFDRTGAGNPDFAAWARAFGGFGAVVEKAGSFEAAFRAAEASGLPSILHVKF